MQRPSYTVVALVVLVLACFAVIKRKFMRLVPPATSNALVGSKAKFLAEAGHQPIFWKTLDADWLREGAESGKPILLVVGISGSKIARRLDDTAFGDSDIARSVSQRFYCIRIDGFEHPEWLNAVLPISRIRQQFGTAFQVWLLGSSGHVLGSLGRSDNVQLSELRQWFDSAEELFRQYGAPDSRRNPFFDQQQLDLDLLKSPRLSALPRFPAATKVLHDAVDPQHGGFPYRGIQTLVPNAWRFLALTGDTRLFKRSLDPLLLSSMVDLQDGGFFNLSESLDFKKVDLDKSTKRNAEMMSTLALEGQIDGDPIYKVLADRTFDWLMSQARQNGYLAACQLDDTDPRGRSPRLSFPNWRLRDSLSGSDADWARQYLDLEPFDNQQMLPRLASKLVLGKDRVQCLRVLGRMRYATQDLPTLSDKGYLDVNGHALARMLELCRLLDDPERQRSVGPLLARLERFRTSTGVVHALDQPKPSAYLGDYLAYADVKLQEYLTQGDVEALQSGLATLFQATMSFKGARDGEFDLTSAPSQMGGVKSFCMPEIADNLGESCSAQMIRLLLAYGRLSADTPAGRDLLLQSRQSASLFANLAGSAGTLTSGYVCAAAEVADDQYALAVGPSALSLANELYRRVPARFVAPVLGRLRPDLQSRGPGIYVVGKTIEGPYTVDEAARLLPHTLVTRHAGSALRE